MYPFSNFKTNRYWAQNPERIAQKFYVTLCLYISAVSDFGVGLDLKDDGKLNWSTTASYYSIVHSARMIIFAAIGDYPQSHADISRLFAGRSQRGVQPNWLENFKRNFSQGINGQQVKFTLDELSRYYREVLSLENSNEIFLSIGNILKNAKDLRNDSNYEALLIAHEYHHVKVTRCFEDLSRSISEGAELCLRYATKCLQSYVEKDETLQDNRHAFKYFIERYVEDRVYSPIRDRIRKPFILERVKECVKPLEKIFSGQQYKPEFQEVVKQYSLLKNQVSMEMFGEKTDLMGGFERKINDLKRNIDSADTKIFKI
jgi:hypothetical protein